MKINLYKKYYNQLKGVKKLRQKKNYFKVINTVNSLFNEKIKLNIKKPFFFPKDYENLIQKIIRQNLMHFSKNLFLDFFTYYGNNKKLKSFLPNEYAEYLEKKFNIKTNKLISKYYLLKLSIHYFFKSLKLIFSLTFNENKTKHDIIFYNTPTECYNNDLNSYNLINWYKKNFSQNNSKSEKILIQNNKVKKRFDYSNVYYDKVINFGGLNFVSKFKFLISLFVPFLTSFVSILLNKWWELILFYELIYLNYIKLVPKNLLPQKLFFNNSQWYYKPLYLNYLENIKKNSTYLLFYSANMENFNYRKFEKIDHYGYNQMDFKNIIVWDKYQKKYIEKYNDKSNIQIFNYVDFIENKTNLEINNPKKLKIISVFDVHPSENILINMMSGYEIPPYYSNEICLNFLKDIAIANQDKFLLLYKSKRIDLKKTNLKKFNINKKKIIDKHFQELHPEISPRRIIEVSNACISIPFTSTSLISKHLSKPTVFYDSQNLLKNEDYHEINVLKNIEDLKNWINKLTL
jgi:polysaccharide biosynthesis PFTS motif protein